jgi:Bacterial regulatory protein, Fis family
MNFLAGSLRVLPPAGPPARGHLERAVLGATTPLEAKAPSEAKALSEVARPGDPVFPAHFPTDLPTLERLAISEALRLEAGNRTRAARKLGISLRTLRNKLRLYRTESCAGGQMVPGNDDPIGAAVRTPTLARPSQSPSSRRAA